MRFLLVVGFILVIGLNQVQAQPCDCGDGNFSIDCCPPEDLGAPVPISGIEILIGAGAVLGIKRFKQNRKPKH